MPTKKEEKKELILLPIPIAGHLASMLEMAKSLLSHNPNFSIKVLMLPPLPNFPSPISNDDSTTKSFSDSDITFIDIPPVEPHTISNAKSQAAFISLFVQIHKPYIKTAISNHLSSSLIIDFFATPVIDIATELDIPTYVYFTSNASTLALTLYLPTLDHLPLPSESTLGVTDIPGMLPVPAVSMPSFAIGETNESYSWFRKYGEWFRETKGLIVNSSEAIESSVLKAIKDGLCVPGHDTPNVYPIGPLLRLHDRNDKQHDCIKWLSDQPTKSVVLLCFGSMGSFGTNQIMETANGIERSGVRFLWALKNDKILPEGFLEATGDRGLVWPCYVPQMEVLSHEAIGGFVTHCGWNSCLESLWHGVPMVAWPLYSEQHYNAFQMVREFGVAVEIEVDRWNGNFVRGEEVERGLKVLMGNEEGTEVRRRATEMKIAIRKGVEEGGSSFSSCEKLLCQLARE